MSHVDDGTLHAYLDGELSPAEAQGVEAHLAQCPSCRGRLEEERALIARAHEVLGLALPPDRELPLLRAGDVKPPARLWWQVRRPLAWAATIVLALGVGTYLGREAAPVRYANPSTAAVPEQRELAQRESRLEARGAARTPPAVAPAPAPALAPAPAAEAARARADNIALPRAQSVVSPADADRPAQLVAKVARRKAWSDEGDRWQKGDVISVDSARRVLGTDPLVVPGVPIEALYRGRAIGYADVVIVEQALDSTTMIEVINARPTPLSLDGIAVTGSVARERAADSLTFSKSAAPEPASAAPQPSRDLLRDVRGPLPPDSLAALRRLLRPLRP